MMVEVQVGHAFILKLIKERLLRFFVEGGDWDLRGGNYALAQFCHNRLILAIVAASVCRCF